ncbi:MAG: rRNA pseudouridine synthase [Clostridia bacterium]|nr:rRNA pseudouridine synthase [Clostridia bacterium]
MRINKYLALCGLGSRRKCEEFVKNGEVKVNNQVVVDLATVVNVKKDKVYYKDNLLTPPSTYVYYKLNKPKGYMCTASETEDRKTIYSLIKSDVRLFSVGRLDYNTEGLIILTNDGDFAEKVSHPSNEIEKEYIVKVEGKMLESELAVLRAGVVENGKRMPPAKVVLLGTDEKFSRLSVKIHEGQNHQVRRMFDAIGKTITLLKRVAIGDVRLGGLKRGEYKPLTTAEYASLVE